MSSSVALSLSRTWRVKDAHGGFYTGGAVAFTPLKQPSTATVSDSGDGAAEVTVGVLVTMFGGDIMLTRLDTGALLRKLPANEDPFIAFAVRPDHQELVTASQSSLLKLWDLTTGQQIKAWRGHDLPVLDMAFDASGTLLATASSDRSVRVWNASKGFCTHSFKGHSGIVIRTKFCPQGADPNNLSLVACTEEGEVRVWSLITNRFHAFQNHMSAVTDVSFSPDGAHMFTCSRDKVLNVWDLEKHSLLKTITTFESLETMVTLPNPCILPPSATALPIKGRHSSTAFVVTSGQDGLVRIWDTHSQRCVYKHSLSNAVAVSESSEKQKESTGDRTAVSHLLLVTWQCPLHDAAHGDASATGDCTCQLIAVTNEQSFYVYPVRTMVREKMLMGFNDEILDVRCLSDNNRVLVATNSAHVRLYDMARQDVDVLHGHSDIVLAVSVSPDGRFAVTGSKDNTVRLWHLGTGSQAAAGTEDEKTVQRASQCIAVCSGHTDSVSAVSSSMDKRGFAPAHLFSGLRKAKRSSVLPGPFMVSGSRDRTLKVWDIKATLAQQLAAHAHEIPDVHIKDSTLQFLRESKHEVLTRVSAAAHDKEINSVAVSPDDSIIASASQDKTIKLWSSSDLKAIGVLRGHKRGVWSIEFSPVDRVLASSSADKTIKLWSLLDHSCLRTFEGHSNSVLRVSFVSQGLQLLSSGADATVRLWTIQTNECVNTFTDAHSDKIWALGLFPDQKRFVTGGNDSKICVWEDATQAELEAAAEQEQQRVLTEQKFETALRESDYLEAVRLALTLSHPRRLRQVLERVVEEDATFAAEDSRKMLVKLISALEAPQVLLCLRYIRDWNTNSRTFLVAQRLLAAVFENFSMAQMVDLMRTPPPPDPNTAATVTASTAADTKSSTGGNVQQELVQPLMMYNERHMQRTRRLLQRSYLLDYVLENLNVLEVNEARPVGLKASDEQLRVLMGLSDDEADDEEVFKQMAAAQAAQAERAPPNARKPAPKRKREPDVPTAAVPETKQQPKQQKKAAEEEKKKKTKKAAAEEVVAEEVVAEEEEEPMEEADVDDQQGDEAANPWSNAGAPAADEDEEPEVDVGALLGEIAGDSSAQRDQQSEDEEEEEEKDADTADAAVDADADEQQLEDGDEEADGFDLKPLPEDDDDGVAAMDEAVNSESEAEEQTLDQALDAALAEMGDEFDEDDDEEEEEVFIGRTPIKGTPKGGNRSVSTTKKSSSSAVNRKSGSKSVTKAQKGKGTQAAKLATPQPNKGKDRKANAVPRTEPRAQKQQKTQAVSQSAASNGKAKKRRASMEGVAPAAAGTPRKTNKKQAAAHTERPLKKHKARH